MASKAHVWMTWSPACGAIGGRSFKQWDLPNGRSEVIGGVPLKELLGPRPSCLSLLPGHHEASIFASPCTSTTISYLAIGPQTMQPSDHGLRPWTQWAKVHLPPYRYFVTAIENWLTQSENSYWLEEMKGTWQLNITWYPGWTTLG
jgi:hypothetical protein